MNALPLTCGWQHGIKPNAGRDHAEVIYFFFGGGTAAMPLPCPATGKHWKTIMKETWATGKWFAHATKLQAGKCKNKKNKQQAIQGRFTAPLAMPAGRGCPARIPAWNHGLRDTPYLLFRIAPLPPKARYFIPRKGIQEQQAERPGLNSRCRQGNDAP